MGYVLIRSERLFPPAISLLRATLKGASSALAATAGGSNSKPPRAAPAAKPIAFGKRRRSRIWSFRCDFGRQQRIARSNLDQHGISPVVKSTTLETVSTGANFIARARTWTRAWIDGRVSPSAIAQINYLETSSHSTRYTHSRFFESRNNLLQEFAQSFVLRDYR